VDTLTHALAGALVARLLCARALPPAAHEPVALAPTGRFGAAWDGRAGALAPWPAVAVGLVAGAFPDIDALTQLAGDMAYLRHHRGVTHSLLLAPLWALLLAVALRGCFAATRAQRGGWKPLYPIALAAIASHIAGDWITQFGTMLLAPLSDARFGLGAVFIIDLAFSGLLVAGLVLAAIWPHRRWPAALGLAAVCAWVGLAWTGKQEAQAIGEQHARAAGVKAEWIETMPRPASPFNWTVVVYDGAGYHVAHVNTRRAERLVAGDADHFVRRFSAPYLPAREAPWQRLPRFGDGTAPAWVRQAWEHASLATYRWFAVAPVLVEAREAGAERCAVFRDLRFEIPGRDASPFRYGVCLRDGAARLVKMEGGATRPV
jgi:inner membrane protein